MYEGNYDFPVFFRFDRYHLRHYNCKEETRKRRAGEQPSEASTA